MTDDERREVRAIRQELTDLRELLIVLRDRMPASLAKQRVRLTPPKRPVAK